MRSTDTTRLADHNDELSCYYISEIHTVIIPCPFAMGRSILPSFKLRQYPKDERPPLLLVVLGQMPALAGPSQQTADKGTVGVG